MSEENHKNPSFLSSIMKAVGLRSRRERALSSQDLFGMGGTFGRARIKHCSTWDIGSDLPPSVQGSRDIRGMASRRREEANFNSHQGKTPHSGDRFSI